MKEMSDSIVYQIAQYKTLAEDYSEWLGSLLRTCEETYKNESWVQKSAAMQKNKRASPKKVAEPSQNGKKKSDGKSKKNESSCWVQSGDILLCSTEQGEAEILFEAIEEINKKTQALDRFKSTLQQLERIGLGKNVNYIVYFKDDIPEKLVLQNRDSTKIIQDYKFEAEFTVPGLNH
jgi:hypothetical protein